MEKIDTDYKQPELVRNNKVDENFNLVPRAHVPFGQHQDTDFLE